MKKLDIGCGKWKTKGSIGLDSTKLDTVDVVWDLNIFPYPFPDNEFDEIYCNHILEHLNDVIKVMKELYRIGKNGCKIFIRAPHASCDFIIWTDPTHKRAFTSGSFDYFDSTSSYSYYSDVNIKVKKIELHFCLYNGRRITRMPFSIIHFFNFMANLNKTARLIFERILAKYIGGFEEIYFELEIIK